MKRYMALAVILMTSMSMMAQETYENTKLAETDLNGTAKYVGMGGALEALGADISTMGTNPAGIGLFRNSSISASMGLRNQQDAHTFSHGSKTQISFDQVGFVYASPNYDGTSFLNFGFTYRKSRDFNQIINASAALDNASQNKLSYQKLRNGVFRNITDLNYTQVDAFYVSNLLYDPVEDAYFYFPASSYQYNRAQEGYIGEYNINISGNINNRVFLGLTFGLHDVHYKHYSEYSEKFVPNEDMIEGLTMIDNRKVTGTGTDIKAGVVVRPVEESPFRIGAYVHTPTWYELITSNLTTLTDKSVSLTKNEEYKFKVYTPWKFGVSLGHTVGNSLALGATYEYTDYSTTSARIKDNDYYYSFMDR
ncbi:MAG: hemin receptor, partial [Prevotella sp.]|nr:hemin receptor [Prevotella sp.]